MTKNKACKNETNSGAIYHKNKKEIYLDKTLFIYVKLVQGTLEAC